MIIQTSSPKRQGFAEDGGNYGGKYIRLMLKNFVITIICF